MCIDDKDITALHEVVDEGDQNVISSFWNGCFAMSEDDMSKERSEVKPDDWKEMVPSQKLLDAVQSLSSCANVLDYGCGTGWASIAAAKAGCRNITAVDVAPNGCAATSFYASLFGVSDSIHTRTITPDWLSSQPSDCFDGFVCSNVLDVVPTKVAEGIIREAARVVKDDAIVVIGLNYWLTPQRAAEKGVRLVDGNRMYRDGVLRMVTRPDEEWSSMFSKHFDILKLDHFAWPGEKAETRRMFLLRKRK